MKKVVITGANGFAGSHILESFHISPTDNFKPIAACRDQRKLPVWYKGDAFIGDLRNANYTNQITQEADIICHAAAWSSLNGASKESQKLFLEPSLQLIDYAVKNKVNRFIFLSSVTSNPIEQSRIHSSRKVEDLWPHYANVLKIEQYLKKSSEKGLEVIVLRMGVFVGKNYSLGILPILLPRLKTQLVPWIKKGETSLPLIDGEDIGQAFMLASIKSLPENFHTINVVGKEIPSVREVLIYLHQKFNYPLPRYNVSFRLAYTFARIAQMMHFILPGEPLIIPAIVLLLEETHADNEDAKKLLGYIPKAHWKESIDIQIAEIKKRGGPPMKLNRST